MKHGELEGSDRGREVAPPSRGDPGRRPPRVADPTLVIAVCLGSTILLLGIGLFFRLVTGLSIIP